MPLFQTLQAKGGDDIINISRGWSGSIQGGQNDDTFNFTNVEGLIIRGITLRNDSLSPNTDGLHISGCNYVRISDVDFDTGDDCLLTPGSKDVVVSNSRFKTLWGFWWPNRACSDITITNCVSF